MKITKYLYLLFAMASCKAQTVINVDGAKQSYGQVGVYYQDINDVFGPFVGTYVYTNGSTSLTIKLEKKVNSSVNGVYTEDALIGAYKLIENGVEKVNVLNSLNNNYANAKNNSIYGQQILTGTAVGCNDCAPNEKRIWGTIKDPVSGSIDRIFIRRTTVNGQQAIKIFILHSITYRAENTPAPPPVSYPLSQDIILIKQP